MLKLRPISIRLFGLFAASLLFFTATAPALAEGSRVVSSWFKHHAKAQFTSDYSDTPGPVDTGTYPQVQPLHRGDFYGTDDLSSVGIANSVEGGATSYPTYPAYDPTGTQDTGDDQALAGRPNPLPRNQQNSLNLPSRDQLLATTDPLAALLSSVPFLRKQSGGDGGTGTNPNPIGSATPTMGSPFPWEGSISGGGSPVAPAVVNPQTGNRMTTMPIMGWRVPGGMSLGLTLYHNSQDNLDLGWGQNWRSNLDMRVVYTGKDSTKTNDKATVIYPDGRRLVFTRTGVSHVPLSAKFYPPTGFYDLLVQQSLGWIVRTKDQISYIFDQNGYLTGIQDRYRNHLSISRDNFHFVRSITDSAGESIALTIAISPGTGTHYVSATPNGGSAYNFTYANQTFNNAIVVLRTATPPALNGNSYPETFNYDINGSIISEWARDGRAYFATYDSQERLSSYSYNVNFYTNPFNQIGNQGKLTYKFAYNSTNTVMTDPYGKTVKLNFDTGTLRSTVDQAGYSDTFTWDINYNLSQYKSRRGYTSYLGYDNYGNVNQVQDPIQYGAGKKVSATYNSWNDVLTVTDSRGAVTTLNRDPSYGEVLSVTDGLSNTLGTFTYNTTGDLATATSCGGTTSVSYNSAGRPASVTTPDQTFTFSYFTSPFPGLVSTVTDGLSRTTNYTYDNWGRTTNVLRPDSTGNQINYDPVGRLTSLLDWNGHQWNFTYDNAGRLASKTNPLGTSQSYIWYDDDRLAGITDGNGHTRQYGYTVRGEQKSFLMANGVGEVYQFDGDGNATGRMNGLSQTTTYTYDPADDLTKVTYPAGTPVTFAYDYDGRTTSMVDATGTTSWAYDNGDRLTSFTSPQGTLNYTYDTFGRRTGLTGPNGYQINYAFSGTRLSSITKLPENEATSFNYDSIGRVQSQNFPNGVLASCSYDALDRLSSISHGSLFSESYTYDANSNILSRTSGGSTTQYTYDTANQLINEATGNTWINYAYDGNGNRSQRSFSNGNIERYSYDSGDALLGLYNGSGATLRSYTYDYCGRPTAYSTPSNTLSLNFDYENRVTSIQGFAATNSYVYNALDTRVGKTDSSGTYVYLRVGEDPTDPVLSDGSYTYNPGISRNSSGGTRFFHDDYLGTHRAESDSNGYLTRTRQYDAFGNLVSTLGVQQGQQGFAGSWGYQEDPDSGLKLLGHRLYDPQVGRFLTIDPAQAGRNWWTYCDNNPLAGIDPDGEWQRIVGQILGGIGGFILSGGNPFGAAAGFGIGGAIGSAAERAENGDVDWIGVAADGAWDGATAYVGGKVLGWIGGKIAGVFSRPGLGAALVDEGSSVASREAAERLAANRLRGKEFENFCREKYRFGPERALSWGGGQYRPDGITDKGIHEVKNVIYQCFTRQLRAYHAAAQASGQEVFLYVKHGTKLAGTLADEHGVSVVKDLHIVYVTTD